MNMRHRLVWLIAAMILFGSCQDSTQTDKRQVVRQKIAAESSEKRKPQESKGPVSSPASPGDVSAKEASPSVDPAAALLASSDSLGVCRYEGVVDPFKPLIKEEKAESTPNDAIDSKPRKKRIPQTPLERIDISQLTLTAVFKLKSGSRALVEEPTGKGYIVKEGAYIGLDGGRITKILKDRIVITEVSEDVMGKPVTVERELKLRQFTGE